MGAVDDVKRVLNQLRSNTWRIVQCQFVKAQDLCLLQCLIWSSFRTLLSISGTLFCRFANQGLCKVKNRKTLSKIFFLVTCCSMRQKFLKSKLVNSGHFCQKCFSLSLCIVHIVFLIPIKRKKGNLTFLLKVFLWVWAHFPSNKSPGINQNQQLYTQSNSKNHVSKTVQMASFFVEARILPL